jgi:cell division protein FtsB
MSGVQDLINAIDSGDSTTIDAAFENEMASRISTKLDDMKVDIAQNMFKSQQEVTDELSAEDLETEQEIEDLDVEVQDTADTPVEESEVEEIAGETEQQEV